MRHFRVSVKEVQQEGSVGQMADQRGPSRPIRRPGRPVRLPGERDATTLPGDRPVRLAWLLAVTRLLHPDPSVVQRSQFVEQLRARGIAADVSRVSRWESGQQVPSGRQLEVYEEVLDLPRWSLVTLQRLLTRLAGGHPGRLSVPSPSDGDPARELELLLAVATAAARDRSDRLTPLDWLRMSDLMTGFDAIYLDQPSWAMVHRRLLAALSISTGVERMQLHEAAAAIRDHPIAGRHLTPAAVEWMRSPDIQEPLAFIASMARTPSEPARIGLLDLAAQLPPAVFDRVLQRVTDPALYDEVPTTAERVAVPAQAARRVSRSVAREVRAARPGPVDLVPDPLLEKMVSELLFGAKRSQRWQASMVLALSPYAAPLAESLVDLATSPSPVLALNGWQALQIVGGQHRSPLLVPAALAETRPNLRLAALSAVAQTPGLLDATSTDAIVAAASAPDVEEGRLALVAAVARHSPDRLAALTPTSATTRSVIRWWQGVVAI